MSNSKMISTPHINAQSGAFASTVLMPGDPQRSRFVAENYLDSAALVNDVRGIQGYTGYYKGERVSVMASGMGMPSMGIYSYELFSFCNVENIIRIGSLGALADNVKLRDIILAQGASTNSAYAAQYSLDGSFAPLADYRLLKVAASAAEAAGARYFVGNVLSSDTFYSADSQSSEKWYKMGVLGVEMEAAALYTNAAYLGKSALAICTVSDHIRTGEALSAQERRETFDQMIRIALETAIKL